jgi:hypothetical protein
VESGGGGRIAGRGGIASREEVQFHVSLQRKAVFAAGLVDRSVALGAPATNEE